MKTNFVSKTSPQVRMITSLDQLDLNAEYTFLQGFGLQVEEIFEE